MSVKERIKAFINFKQISMREFCRQVGVSNSYVSSMRSSIQPDKLLRIAHVFPELNSDWLMTGEGDMIRKTHELQPTERDDLISTGSEVFKDKLLDMFKKGEIFSSAIVWEQHRLIIEKSQKIEDLIKEVQALKSLLAQHGIKP